MLNAETDLLFPPKAIEALTLERHEKWQQLVAAVEASSAESINRTAFILLMARLNSCSTCNSDSFRAMNGCVVCSKQSLKRYKGSDEELAKVYESNQDEVRQFLLSRK